VQVFKALADPVPLHLVPLIVATRAVRCVYAADHAFDLPQPTISHHLKVRRGARIPAPGGAVPGVCYWLVPAALERVAALLSPPTG
jgi:ArsR family transcriptional regulator, arsenate/arsenite/antimonite-responsive transcriptional repressor